MATEVVMPQMGESIAEGTITKWLVAVGEKVERDQPLFEISTDKVDAEIPSPAAGVLVEITVKEGETVPVGSVVASIGAAGAKPAAASGASAFAPAGASARPAAPVHAPAPVARLDGDVVEPMSIMRRKIAEHMVLSKRTSAHVYSVFEVDYSRVDEVRRARKAEYERQGAKLTFTAFIAKALADTLRRHPTLNASIDGDNVIYRRDVHLGVAVSLDNGLIVPVIKDAAEKSLLGIARAIQDVADRARAKKLSPDEVHGGTVTLTNPGGYGAQFGLPIINQPQVAILAVGTIEKRPVVIDDMIGIRLRGYLAMGFDHRLVDGAAADQFLADLKHYLEHFDAKQA